MDQHTVRGGAYYDLCQRFGVLRLETVSETGNFARIPIWKQELIKYINGKIAHMLLGLGIIRHWKRQLVWPVSH